MSIPSVANQTISAEKDQYDPGPALEVEGLTFSYRERKALDDVSFAIQRGEIFGFLGPNGGGKTTLFRLLSTLVRPESGAIRMFGADFRDGTMEARRRLGVVFQHPSVDGKLTVLENFIHHGHLYGLSGQKLKARCALSLDRLGLAERRGDLVETLSGGLRRRVELGKALLHEPDLLLLDEPSTGLDPSARREFCNYLGHLRASEGVTIVLTTHYMEEAERCDRIGLLHQGQLVSMAPPVELKARVGGDVVVIHSRTPEALGRKLQQRFRIGNVLVDGAIRIERPRGQDIVREVVDAFGDDIDSVTFGKPTLEDVFVHLTGQQLFSATGAGK